MNKLTVLVAGLMLGCSHKEVRDTHNYFAGFSTDPWVTATYSQHGMYDDLCLDIPPCKESYQPKIDLLAPPPELYLITPHAWVWAFNDNYVMDPNRWIPLHNYVADEPAASWYSDVDMNKVLKQLEDAYNVAMTTYVIQKVKEEFQSKCRNVVVEKEKSMTSMTLEGCDLKEVKGE